MLLVQCGSAAVRSPAACCCSHGALLHVDCFGLLDVAESVSSH